MLVRKEFSLMSEQTTIGVEQVIIIIIVISFIIGTISFVISNSIGKGMSKLSELVIPTVEALVLLVTEEAVEKSFQNGEYIPDVKRTIRKQFGGEIKKEWLDVWLKSPTIMSIQPRHMIEKVWIGHIVRYALEENGVSSQISPSSQLFSTIHYTIEYKEDRPTSYASARLVIVGQLISYGNQYHLIEEFN